MSDDERQQPEQVQVAQAEPPEQQKDRWGDPISMERQNELRGYLDRWENEQDHGERRGPFYRVPLTGADVAWLADQSVHDAPFAFPNLHLEGADPRWAHLQRAGLGWAHLEGADLYEAHLEGADLGWAHLEGAFLHAAHLEGVNLRLKVHQRITAKLHQLVTAKLHQAAWAGSSR